MPDNQTIKLNLRDLAAIALRELEETAEEQGDELFEQHQEEVLSFARGVSRRILGDEASAQLEWRYTGTMHLPPDTEEATALVDDGPAYLRYRIADEEVSFELVLPCSACGHQEISEVTSLPGLGGLLEAAMWRRAEVSS